jgi:hypothetical protein
MTRDSNIPLFLWIAMAVLAHLAWGGGATRLSKALEETLDIRRFALSVQRQVRSGGGNVEVSLLEESAEKEHEQKPDETLPKADDAEPDPSTGPEQEDETAKRDLDKKKDDTKPEPVQPEEKKEPPRLELKKEEPKQEAKREAAKELPKIATKNRIAVVQHVDEKNQKDNPNAEFIGPDANRVKEQTQARNTATDQNDKNPTPGGNHSGPTPAPGNSDESKVAQSEDRPGEADRAPNEDTQAPEKDKPSKTASAAAPPPPSPGDKPAQPGAEQGSKASASQEPAQAGQKGQSSQKELEPSPDSVAAPGGPWSVAEGRPGQQAKTARKAKKKRLPPMKGQYGANDLLGLGALGTTSSGVNLNLTPQQALAAVGRDRLTKERKLDAERRKSAHRGSWKSVGIEKWRAAIENYVPSVKPGNQTALNTARVPFAAYLNTVHNRLHPIFADSFLASLDSLPGSHPMNQPDIKTHLEIVLNQDDGKVVRMGITHTSGVTAFDIAALESVMRAQPFGAPPREIVSPDGNVYFHWEFYRNPFYACSTYFAHPYILKGQPKTAPPSIEPKVPGPWRTHEDPNAGQRTGETSPTVPKLEKRASLR